MPNATNAGAMVVIDGAEYHLSPPGLFDWEWLQTAMRAEFIAACRAELSPSLTKDQEAEQIASIRAQAFRMEALGPEGYTWLRTTPGLVRLVYCLLRHNHPDVSIEQCGQWVVFEQKSELLSAATTLLSDSLPSRRNGEPKKKPASQLTNRKIGRR